MKNHTAKKIISLSCASEIENRNGCLSNCDPDLMRVVLRFLYKAEIAFLLRTSKTIRDIIIATKPIEPFENYFPKELPDDFKGMNLKKLIGSLEYDFKVIMTQNVWSSGIILQYCLVDNELNGDVYVYAAKHGQVDVLEFFKDTLRAGINKLERDYILMADLLFMTATQNMQVDILMFLKNEYGYNIEKLRGDEYFLLKCSIGLITQNESFDENKLMKLFEFIRNELKLTVADLHACSTELLYVVSLNGCTNGLKFLKEWGLTINDVRDQSNLTLRTAARHGHINVLKVLIETYNVKLTHKRVFDCMKVVKTRPVMDYLKEVKLNLEEQRNISDILHEYKALFACLISLFILMIFIFCNVDDVNEIIRNSLQDNYKKI